MEQFTEMNENVSIGFSGTRTKALIIANMKSIWDFTVSETS